MILPRNLGINHDSERECTEDTAENEESHGDFLVTTLGQWLVVDFEVK